MSERPQPKERLRRDLQLRRSRLSSEARRRKSLDLEGHLRNWLVPRVPHAIALYAAREFEIDPGGLRLWANRQGIEVFYPRVGPGASMMDFLLVGAGDDLRRGAFGILEPAREARRLRNADRPLVVIVPGLAFDSVGHRIGNGRGYYDRALSRMGGGVTRIGVGYSFQIRASIPTDPWDQKMDLVATEDCILDCGAGMAQPGASGRGSL